MAIVLRIVLSLGGALLIFMGSGFLTDPVGSAVNFGIAVEGAHGITSVRSDFTAFFVVGGASLLWGAWSRRPDPLIVGAALMLVTLAARLVSLAINGSFEGYLTPMGVELILGVSALIGAKILPVQER